MKAIIAFTSALLLLPGVAIAEDRPANHDLYPIPEFHTRSATAQAAWLAYGTAISHISKQANLPPQPPPIVLPLEQEADARSVMVSVWQANRTNEKEPLDSYLETLSLVSDSGYMKEYVWVYIRRKGQSPPPTNLRLDTFAKWAAENLQGHEAETLIFVGTGGQ